MYHNSEHVKEIPTKITVGQRIMKNSQTLRVQVPKDHMVTKYLVFQKYSWTWMKRKNFMKASKSCLKNVKGNESDNEASHHNVDLIHHWYLCVN